MTLYAISDRSTLHAVVCPGHLALGLDIHTSGDAYLLDPTLLGRPATCDLCHPKGNNS